MNTNYDAIVVGANISGVISAIKLLNKGYKVILLDNHNDIGGLDLLYRKGRFLFNREMPTLYLDSNKFNYCIDNILNEFKVIDKPSFSKLDNLVRVIGPDTDFVLPFGISSFMNKINELVPGAEESVNNFINVALECREALEYINENLDNIDYDLMRKDYNNFTRVSTYSVSRVMDELDVPIPAQEIINSLWLLLGSSETEISFVEYAVFLVNALEFGLRVPTYGNYDVTSTLVNKFILKGGELKLNAKVTKLLVEDDKVNGVKLEDSTIIYSNYVIINGMLHNVYGKLMDPSIVPRKALKNVNKRIIGGRLFQVNLGLNRSPEQLGLDNYLYAIYKSMDSDVERDNMKELDSVNQLTVINSLLNKDVGKPGTTNMTINTVFFDDCYGDEYSSDTVFDTDREIAKRLIRYFEKKTGINIYDYIEEIDIKSPLDTAAFNDSPEGCTYGYKLVGSDNMLPRMLNRKNENYVSGLYVTSGFKGDLYGYDSSIYESIYNANQVINDMKGGK